MSKTDLAGALRLAGAGHSARQACGARGEEGIPGLLGSRAAAPGKDRGAGGAQDAAADWGGGRWRIW